MHTSCPVYTYFYMYLLALTVVTTCDNLKIVVAVAPQHIGN